jgi:hypothetical protein
MANARYLADHQYDLRGQTRVNTLGIMGMGSGDSRENDDACVYRRTSSTDLLGVGFISFP